VKSYGQRLPKCGTQQVSRELAADLNAELREVLAAWLKGKTLIRKNKTKTKEGKKLIQGKTKSKQNRA
jgi:hypothetical protein